MTINTVLELELNDFPLITYTQGNKFAAFVISVIKQLAVNLNRLHGLGAGKIAVTALEPLGCLPRATFLSSFQQCNLTQNKIAVFHNMWLNDSLSRLNNESRDSAYHVLDLYTAFTTALEHKGDVTGNLNTSRF